jgi:Na+/melibiose symporter-like transporter
MGLATALLMWAYFQTNFFLILYFMNGLTAGFLIAEVTRDPEDRTVLVTFKKSFGLIFVGLIFGFVTMWFLILNLKEFKEYKQG